MNISKKLTYVTLLEVTFLLLTLFQVVKVDAVESNGTEKSLWFLSDVVMLDLSKYNVTLRKDDVTYPAEYAGVPREDLTYRLEINSIDLSADFVYLNQKFWRCQINLHGALPEDSMVYVQPLPADVVGLAKVVLENYQAYRDSSVYQPMRDLLASVDKTENVTVASGEYRLDISVIHSGHSVTFDWVVGEAGLEETALGLAFQDGALYVINDRMGVFNFSNAEVMVSEEEAIDIAIEEALSCSWTVIVEGSQQSVRAEGVAFVRPTTKLFLTVHSSRDPFTYYPFWSVNVWLGKVYLGGVSYVSVGLWADTGEVVYVKALGHGGGAPAGDSGGSDISSSAPSSSSPSSSSGTLSSSSDDSSLQDPLSAPDSEVPSSSDPSSESTQQSERAVTAFSTTLIIAAAVSSAVLICAGLLLYFNKFKKRNAP